MERIQGKKIGNKGTVTDRLAAVNVPFSPGHEASPYTAD
jgi:hypothetical protein